jgi:hypothetical protein
VSEVDLGTVAGADLTARMAELEARAVPLRAQLDEVRAEMEAIRTELRRRERESRLAARKQVRAEMAAGGMVKLEDAIADPALLGGVTSLEALRFLRESATEVRLGYASAARQAISFTDGRRSEDAEDLEAAAGLWRQGWELGTTAAKGVRIYPLGSRAERMVAAAELSVQAR